MRKTWLIILLLSFVIPVFSQIKVSGTLKDSVTNLPIQYSRVSLGEPNNVVLSDKNGFFEIICSKPGKLQITNVQYGFKEYIINQNADLGVIQCIPQVYQLPAFVFNPNKSTKIAGEYDSRNIIKRKGDRYFYRSAASIIVSLFIKNPSSNGKNALIDTLNYYIIDSSKDGYPFRVQVYEVIPNKDGTLSHGKALIRENIILRYPEYEGWVRVDVKKYGIKIPPEGVFVSLEFLESVVCKGDVQKTANHIIPSSTLFDQISDSNKNVRKCGLHILFSKSNKSVSQWTQSSTQFSGFSKDFKYFGDQTHWGQLNTGNPLIYINYSSY